MNIAGETKQGEEAMQGPDDCSRGHIRAGDSEGVPRIFINDVGEVNIAVRGGEGAFEVNAQAFERAGGFDEVCSVWPVEVRLALRADLAVPGH